MEDDQLHNKLLSTKQIPLKESGRGPEVCLNVGSELHAPVSIMPLKSSLLSFDILFHDSTILPFEISVHHRNTQALLTKLAVVADDLPKNVTICT